MVLPKRQEYANTRSVHRRAERHVGRFRTSVTGAVREEHA